MMDNRSDRQRESARTKKHDPCVGSGSFLSFIHSSLDEAELTPDEFKVYCHLLRRLGRAACSGNVSARKRSTVVRWM